ncbi:hypothetical protein KCU85_g2796, partial [Aureobasidium melanogenum]
MNDPALHSAAITMESSILSKPALLTLPVEMIERILWLADKPDLANLRLVSRSICTIANRPFAIRNFSNSHHVITEDSINTLFAVSAHKVFGAYIKTIMISPARTIIAKWRNHDSSVDENARNAVADYYFRSGKFKQLIRRIFLNLKQHTDSIALAIHEDRYLLHEDPDGFKHRTQCHGATALLRNSRIGIAFRTPETLQFIAAAMKMVGIGINRLDLELHRDSIGGGKRKTDQAIVQLLRSSMSPSDFHLRWNGFSVLRYEHTQSSLCFSEQFLITEQRQDRRGVFSDVLVLDEVVQWLTETFSRELCLRELCADRLFLLNAYFKQSLHNITLIDIILGSEYFADGVYSSLFKLLSELPDLRYCKLHRLHYGLIRRDNPCGCYFRLLSKAYPTGWESLVLFFPNGTTEFEVTGSDVSKQLQDLAAYAAAAETRKIEEVEAAQEVIDHRVIGANVPVSREDFPGFS